MKYYYFHCHLPSEQQDMLDGPRIAELNRNDFVFRNDEGEGPFESISELKKKSKFFKRLVLENPKRAEKIANGKFIVKVEKIIAWPEGLDDEYMKMVYRIMQHSSNGSVKRKGVSGVHLYNKDKVKIVKILKADENTGVFKAEIEVLNDRTGRFIRKQNATTFFPVHWDLQRLIIECYEAYKNKIQISERIHQGLTPEGIRVEFVYTVDNQFVSVYPVLNDLI